MVYLPRSRTILGTSLGQGIPLVDTGLRWVENSLSNTAIELDHSADLKTNGKVSLTLPT